MRRRGGARLELLVRPVVDEQPDDLLHPGAGGGHEDCVAVLGPLHVEVVGAVCEEELWGGRSGG